MSYNQARVDRNDGPLRRSGGRSNNGRGFSGGGSGGKSGGGGGGLAAPNQQNSSTSSSNQPSVSSNRSLKKSGNGQGGQSRINPMSQSSEAPAAITAPRAVQNGAHGHMLTHGPSTAPVPSNPKPGDASMPRVSRAVPKSPSSQSAAGISETAAVSTPTKGDGTESFALQFGTISPGHLQIPARTSSAPPNLDEQKRDQARHDVFRAVPTQPIPPGPKQQTQPSKKDVVSVNQPTTGESHPSVQVKREIHVQVPAVSAGPPPQSAAVPLPALSMAMPFHQPPVAMQFGLGQQQMPMTLPIGNAPQMSQPIFLHNLQSHPLQSQAMIHQGQALSFGPQISHQLGPQLGNLGVGMPAPQFAQQQQQQQQQPGKFGGPRKTTVKITHPHTHEELRLDKRTNSYADGGSSGQRPPSNAMPQSQPMASFAPAHYFSQIQPNSYINTPPMFFQPGPSVAGGPQPPRFSYPVGQSGQPISFMNPSIITPMSGNKPVAPLQEPSEPVKSEQLLVTAPSAPTQPGKPTATSVAPKVGGSPVTISMPVSKAGEPKLVKPPVEATVNQQRDSEIPIESSFQQLEMLTRAPGITPTGKPVVVTSAVSTQRAIPGTSLSPAGTSGNSGSLVSATNGKKKEPIRRLESLKEHQKQSSKPDLRPSQQQHQTDMSASEATTNLPDDGTSANANNRRLNEGTEDIREGGSSSVDISATTSNFPSCPTENNVSTEVQNDAAVKSKDLPVQPNSSAFRMEEEEPLDVTVSCSDSFVVDGRSRTPINETVSVLPSYRSTPETEVTVSGGQNSDVHRIDKAYLEAEFRNRITEESEISAVDSGNGTAHPIPVVESAENEKYAVLINFEDRGSKYSEKLIYTADLKRASNVTEGQDSVLLEDRNAVSNGKDVSLTVSGLSQPEAVVGKVPATEKKDESGVSMEDPKDGAASTVKSGPKDKLPIESTKANFTGKRKKRREILSKADAAGTSDLYNAYKGPEEKHQLANTSEIVDRSLIDARENVDTENPDTDVIAKEGDGQSKGEVDDWEDAADVSTPKLENGKQVTEAHVHPNDDNIEATGTKKYTRDFLLTFLEQCIDLPVDFGIGSDIADALMSVPFGSPHVGDMNHGRMNDRSPGVSRSDRRGSGMMSDDKWTKGPGSFPLHMDVGLNFRPGQVASHGVLRNPRGQPPNQLVPILTGPMQPMGSQGGPVRNNSDADRWRSANNSRGIMPPPQTPLQVMHKAERKYEVGKVSDEEQAKQRLLKGILNKLTPQHFEKLFQQVKDVNIDNTVTLSGVISQIFDKALMEPTFCEMYADFCFRLSGVLPDFTENNEKVTFKRLLLNKCQEEFERGEREQAEANRIEEEGEIKQSAEEREEKRIKARRRMLGNIRLIGELYKKKMLTERIMHECIQKLLGQYQNPNPDEEDLEALCKLMSTIGDQIDHAKAKEHIDAYFDAMMKLSTNQKLSSRIRFMLRDVIDLRKNRWHQRRKVEGPKKIDEVHRDAAQERQSQSSRLSRGPSMNSSSRRGPPVDYSLRGSSVLPSPTSQIGGIRTLPMQGRGYGNQDVRLDTRSLENRTSSLPLTQRPHDDSITLGPQGGLAKGMSIRGQPPISIAHPADSFFSSGDDCRMASGPNGYTSTVDRVPRSSREDATLRYMPERSSETLIDHPSIHDRNAYVAGQESRITDHSFNRFTSTAVSAGRIQGSLGGNAGAASDAKPLSEEALREKSMSTIKEFYSVEDEKEVALCIKELNSPSFYPSMISLWVTDSFERKDKERDLLATLLVNLCKHQDSLLSQVQLSQGFESVLSSLEDAVNDAPRAAEFLGRIFVKVILENVVPLRDVGKLIHKGGEEPGRLLENGLASEVLGSILEIIKAEKGVPVLNEILMSSKIHLEDFRPPNSIESKKLDAFL